jgi:taurine--2-oxoglutarate transaminase
MLAELKDRHPSVGDVRSIGLFGVIELVKNAKTQEPLAPFGENSPEVVAIRRYLLDHGVFVYTHWNTLLIIPPLIITQKELGEGLAMIDDALMIADRVVA